MSSTREVMLVSAIFDASLVASIRKFSHSKPQGSGAETVELLRPIPCNLGLISMDTPIFLASGAAKQKNTADPR